MENSNLKPIDKFWITQLKDAITYIKKSDLCKQYVEENLKNEIILK